MAVALVYLAARWPLLDVPLDRDEGVFGWIGQSILRGDLPYRDVFDHKPPGAFYLYALALLIVPPTAVGVHAFLLVWNAATCAVLAGLARTLAGPRAAFWTALSFVIVSASPSVQGFTASTEMLLLLPLAGSVWCAVCATRAEGRRRIVLLVASGALGAGACWIKQSAAVALLVAPGLVLLNAGTGVGSRVGALCWWLAGGVALSTLVVAPFALAGAWSEFWYWSFEHTALYTDWSLSVTTQDVWWDDAAEVLGDVGRDTGVLLLAGAAGCALAFRRRRAAVWIALAFLVVSLASALQSGFLYPHYFAQAAPAIALVSGIGLARLAAVRGKATFGVALAVVLGTPLLLLPEHWVGPDPVKVSIRALGPQAFEAAPLLARHVRETTAPEDPVLIVGSEPQIAFLARRRSTNPYGMMYPLTGPFPRQRAFQQRVLERMERDPPALVLMVQRIGASLLVGPETDTRFLTEIDRRLRSGYRLEALLLRDDARDRWELRSVARDAPEPRTGRAAFVAVWRRE